MNLPLEPILDPRGRIASRHVPEFLRKAIATCDFPRGAWIPCPLWISPCVHESLLLMALASKNNSGEHAYPRNITRAYRQNMANLQSDLQIVKKTDNHTHWIAVHICLDWLQSFKQFFTNVSCHILVTSLTLMALF